MREVDSENICLICGRKTEDGNSITLPFLFDIEHEYSIFNCEIVHKDCLYKSGKFPLVSQRYFEYLENPKKFEVEEMTEAEIERLKNFQNEI